MSDYSDLLKDPRWEKHRKMLLNAHGYECMKCGATDIRLQVHHKYYKPGVLPWNYPVDAYEILCVNCHREKHAEQNFDQYPAPEQTRPVKSIRQVMIDFIEHTRKKLKGNG
jgi:5-methylcytosine-specific restriction endonuclease McrA